MEEDSLQQVECRVCYKTKPFSEFVKDKAYKNDIRPECKECRQKRMNSYLEKWKKERTQKTPPEEKKCSSCMQTKPVSDYTKDKYSKDGLSHYCRDCKAKRHKALVDKWKKERKQRQEIPDEKTCNTCHRLLSKTCFTSNVGSKDGLNGICKECEKKQVKRYKKRWKEERAQRHEKISEKKCPSCNRVLDLSFFYSSNAHKDGLSFYCKSCELKNQALHRDKWEEEREKNQIKTPREKECNVCHRTLPAALFYKNRALKDGLHSTCIQCEKNRGRDYRDNWTAQRKHKNAPGEKECIICHRKLPISMFYKNIRRKDGYNNSCMDCEKQRGLRYVEKWKDERIQGKKDEGFTLFPSFEKKCKMCKKTLPISLFYKKSRSKDGLSPNCRNCDLILAKENSLKRKSKGIKKEIPVEKFCKRCQRMLPSSMFHRLWSAGDGLAPHCKDCKREIYRDYLNKPGVRERLSGYKKEYRERPGVKEHERKRARKYSKKPSVREKRKAYFKEYYGRPEVKEKRKKYLNEYYSRPEVKKRVKQYYVDYQNRKKTA
ncbi:hypothetical protein AYK24_08435 [Thermoplasmatales archaeon SG8-52-4]|nr:MAG: hypothetical protein AYK24_08435 [Thermoplasmatales archaeon SG8-52-4]